MAGLAAGTIADCTGKVYAHAGLGVGVELRLEPNPTITVQRLRDEAEQTLEVSEGESLVDPESLELVKHGEVGGVDGLISVDTARTRDADRELRLGLEYPCLNGRGVRP